FPLGGGRLLRRLVLRYGLRGTAEQRRGRHGDECACSPVPRIRTEPLLPSYRREPWAKARRVRVLGCRPADRGATVPGKGRTRLDRPLDSSETLTSSPRDADAGRWKEGVRAGRPLARRASLEFPKRRTPRRGEGGTTCPSVLRIGSRRSAWR